MRRHLRTLLAAFAAGLLLGACAQPGGGYGDTSPTYGGSSPGYGQSGGYQESTSGYEGSRYDTCPSCGTVQKITVLEETSEGIGAGAILGTIAGGVLGTQVGSGKGKTAATIAGAAGGAFAGHELQKRRG